ncbi:hypothetical protein B0F90DRAFT_1774622, partial [Multifurca ochricompacta]
MNGKRTRLRLRSLTRQAGGIPVWHESNNSAHSEVRWDDPERVHWVTPVTKFNRQENSFATYGNDLSVEMLYGDLCLVVRIGKAGERLSYPTVAWLKKLSRSGDHHGDDDDDEDEDEGGGGDKDGYGDEDGDGDGDEDENFDE